MPTIGKWLFLIFLIAIIIGGIISFLLTEKQRRASNEKVFNSDFLDWEKVTNAIPWEPRDSHEVIVFQDKLWLFGGLNVNDYVERPGSVKYNQAPHFSDIWMSEDGRNWNLVTDKALWGKRRSIQATVFKGKIWLIPGWGPLTGTKNEIYNSEDGIHWNLINKNPNFPAREGHQLVVFKDKLWVIGGVDYEKKKTKNDVWYSEDGINWFEATLQAPWAPRWDHAVIAFKDKLWLIGGMDLKGNVFQDVWVTENGIDWSLVTDNPPWPKRQGFGAVVFKDKLWLVGRFNDKSQGGKNDVWYSEDGINWKKTKKDPPWSGREDHAVVVFQNRIWVLGGMTVDWVCQNDIWYSK